MPVRRVLPALAAVAGLVACAGNRPSAPPGPVDASAVGAAVPGSPSELAARPICGVDAGGGTAYVSMNTTGSDTEMICAVDCVFPRSNGTSARVAGQFFLRGGASTTRLLEQNDIPAGGAVPAAFTSVSRTTASCAAR